MSNSSRDDINLKQRSGSENKYKYWKDANINKQESEAEGKIIFTSEDTSGSSSIVGKVEVWKSKSISLYSLWICW